jgi:glycosyltransferase involved in cell wall biosynthesis
MRLLFVIYGSIDTLSGGYLYDRMLIRTLEQRGHQVFVLSQRPRPCYMAHIPDNLDASFIRTAIEYEPDIVLEDELNHPSLFILNLRLKAALGVPVVGMVHHLRQLEHNGFIDAALARVLERRYLGNVDGFIFNSAFTRDSVLSAIAKGAAVPSGKPFVIALPGKDRLGLDTGASPASATTGRPRKTGARILFLGNVIARKGLHVLVAALGRLSREDPGLDWSLSIAGSAKADPGYAAGIAAAVRDHALGGKVVWLGVIGDAALPAVFQSHDVLAVPSQCEGFGIVYAEAMVYGLPVIAGLYGGAVEIVTDGGNGFLVPWGDELLLAQKLEVLIRDPGLRARMGEAARRKAEQLPGWEQSMAAAAAFLEGMVQDGQEPQSLGRPPARYLSSPAGCNGSASGYQQCLEQVKEALHARCLGIRYWLETLPQLPSRQYGRQGPGIQAARDDQMEGYLEIRRRMADRLPRLVVAQDQADVQPLELPREQSACRTQGIIDAGQVAFSKFLASQPVVVETPQQARLELPAVQWKAP